MKVTISSKKPTTPECQTSIESMPSKRTGTDAKFFAMAQKTVLDWQVWAVDKEDPFHTHSDSLKPMLQSLKNHCNRHAPTFPDLKIVQAKIETAIEEETLSYKFYTTICLGIQLAKSDFKNISWEEKNYITANLGKSHKVLSLLEKPFEEALHNLETKHHLLIDQILEPSKSTLLPIKHKASEFALFLRGKTHFGFEFLVNNYSKLTYPIAMPNKPTELDGIVVSPFTFTLHDIDHREGGTVCDVINDKIMGFSDDNKPIAFKYCLDKFNLTAELIRHIQESAIESPSLSPLEKQKIEFYLFFLVFESQAIQGNSLEADCLKDLLDTITKEARPNPLKIDPKTGKSPLSDREIFDFLKEGNEDIGDQTKLTINRTPLGIHTKYRKTENDFYIESFEKSPYINLLKFNPKTGKSSLSDKEIKAVFSKLTDEEFDFFPCTYLDTKEKDHFKLFRSTDSMTVEKTFARLYMESPKAFVERNFGDIYESLLKLQYDIKKIDYSVSAEEIDLEIHQFEQSMNQALEKIHHDFCDLLPKLISESEIETYDRKMSALSKKIEELE